MLRHYKGGAAAEHSLLRAGGWSEDRRYVFLLRGEPTPVGLV
jgi:hypothetical protein